MAVLRTNRLGPGREGRGAGEQELLPLLQGGCGCGFLLYLSNRSQRGHGRPCRQAKQHATAMAGLRALLAAVVAWPQIGRDHL